jgi:hypothetical protein
VKAFTPCRLPFHLAVHVRRTLVDGTLPASLLDRMSAENIGQRPAGSRLVFVGGHSRGRDAAGNRIVDLCYIGIVEEGP